MFSKISLKLYGMIKQGIIKSNAMFWREFFDEKKINNTDIDLFFYEDELKEKEISLISVFDRNFPIFNLKIKNNEKPFIFAYKGNFNLIEDISKNIAIIGVLTPTKDIEQREEKIVKELVNNGINIISGLAKGCDTTAHKTCLSLKGKTIAILPSTLDKIYPNENKLLAEEIIKNKGLILTEYIVEPKNKFERLKRFIERDRLQALFSKAVILVASFAGKNGDSGSRHALQKAKEYKKKRYVMFNKNTDLNRKIFELNIIQNDDGAEILTNKNIKELF